MEQNNYNSENLINNNNCKITIGKKDYIKHGKDGGMKYEIQAETTKGFFRKKKTYDVVTIDKIKYVVLNHDQPLANRYKNVILLDYSYDIKFIGRINKIYHKKRCEFHGVMTDTDGAKYEGEWKDGKMDGQGVCTYTDGAKYEGEWNNNKQNGKGIMTYSNGSKYEGEYEGEWKNGKKHGQGVYTYTDGSKYEGEWKDDKKHGKGVYTYSNGSKYEGEWKDDKMDGKGVHTYTDGSKYEGEWKDGKINIQYNGNDENHQLHEQLNCLTEFAPLGNVKLLQNKDESINHGSNDIHEAAFLFNDAKKRYNNKEKSKVVSWMKILIKALSNRKNSTDDENLLNILKDNFFVNFACHNKNQRELFAKLLLILNNKEISYQDFKEKFYNPVIEKGEKIIGDKYEKDDFNIDENDFNNARIFINRMNIMHSQFTKKTTITFYDHSDIKKTNKKNGKNQAYPCFKPVNVFAINLEALRNKAMTIDNILALQPNDAIKMFTKKNIEVLGNKVLENLEKIFSSVNIENPMIVMPQISNHINNHNPIKTLGQTNSNKDLGGLNQP